MLEKNIVQFFGFTSSIVCYGLLEFFISCISPLEFLERSCIFLFGSYGAWLHAAFFLRLSCIRFIFLLKSVEKSAQTYFKCKLLP